MTNYLINFGFLSINSKQIYFIFLIITIIKIDLINAHNFNLIYKIYFIIVVFNNFKIVNFIINLIINFINFITNLIINLIFNFIKIIAIMILN